MNCEEFELSVRDLVRNNFADRNFDQSHGANESRRELVDARRHVGACAACALRLQDERALNHQLGSLAREMEYLGPAARIESELLNAFRQTVAHNIPGSAGILPASSIQSKDGQDARAHRGLRLGGGPAYWLTAAAAVLLIVFGIVLVRAKLSPRLPEAPVADIHQLSETNAPAGDATPVPADGPGGKGSPGSIPANVSPPKGSPEIAAHRMRTKPRRLIPQSAKDDVDASLLATSAAPLATDEETEPEVTTQFIALSYVAAANLQDGGQIVRVELPRSAMANFGLPVNMERLGERVKADVLVSADGFARAIRFVQ